MSLDFDSKRKDEMDDVTTVDEGKKTILIYSPDLNFCFSLSMLFQDRYNVITTTNPAMLDSFVAHYSANLLIIDASPTKKMLERIHSLKDLNKHLPIIMLYVFSSKETSLDRAARNVVDSVFYKPFDLAAVSKLINELLPGEKSN
jgi:DNA-binding NtrC family response regulator